jgi:hypothetical protein
MPDQNDILTAFFQEFQHATNSADIDSILPKFADPFTVATPQGPQIVRAADFAGFLPRRKALFDQLGCQQVSLASLKPTPLNPHFTLVDTTWQMRFAPPGQPAQHFTVASTYLVYLNGSAVKIILYMPHQDIMTILRDRGILTAAAEAPPA